MRRVHCVQSIALQINTAPLILGTIPSATLLLTAIIIVWPSITTRSNHADLALDDASLLEVTWLDTSRVAARLADVDVRKATVRRRAGMFKVAIADRQLVPLDGEEEPAEVDRLTRSLARLQDELSQVRKEPDECEDELKQLRWR
jgi:hypothetical protein